PPGIAGVAGAEQSARSLVLIVPSAAMPGQAQLTFWSPCGNQNAKKKSDSGIQSRRGGGKIAG
ncbi:MAG: hypothetical protein AAF651_11020, partial [Cyanobacteria bacterium P01_C01_bin.73]